MKKIEIYVGYADGDDKCFVIKGKYDIERVFSAIQSSLENNEDFHAQLDDNSFVFIPNQQLYSAKWIAIHETDE